MRQQDYTRKTTEAAELTKQAQQERQFVQQEYGQRINQLDNLSAALYQELVGNQAELAKLIETDPQEYLRQQQRMSQKAALLNQVDQQRQAIDQIRKNEEEKAFHESVKVNEAKLLDALPDWRDSTKRGAEQREIAQHLISLGYSPDELNSLTDHRAVLIARKAMLWDRAQAVKSKQTQEQKTPPKVVKPGTANSPTNAKTQQIQQLAQKAKRSGRDDDVVALLMARSDRG
ncbi:hypothetical protein [Dyella sp. SG609]|uniref:hypothetical protein n=1 Tax=Dyella sp. SG609 TaxID=2587018 RepID=UPI001444C72B|nr:hypothetical protein [Dyella sp. SG609]NKJ22016.1 uncharacterized membrane-anchored protein YhcB (DUF1043 family) [Dyella sp. SG609]